MLFVIDFHQTVMGKKFIERDVPYLIHVIEELNELKKDELEMYSKHVFALEKQNLLKERELELKEEELKLKRIELEK